mmetsp:Transcript_55329/g.91530  ORF Transcript_55329/g.91530 Transcript_55329/m.91530 type:complete len:291 (+) Transcript_55329:713-1585(+)
MAASRAATAAVSSAMSAAHFAIEAVSSSISALSCSTAAVFSARVLALVAISVSHQPLCSASSFASSMSFTMRSLIIFFTFWNGSSEMRAATCESKRLLSALACLCRKVATRAWASVALTARSMARADVFLPACCSMLGKYVSAAPDTELLAMIEIAFSIASNSSARNSCRDSKSDVFCAQVASKSALYLLSAAKTAEASSRSPVASAFICSSWALSSDFFVASDVDLAMALSRSAISISYACLEFISVFSRSVRFSVNSSRSFSSMSTTPPDWNSYAFASGAAMIASSPD